MTVTALRLLSRMTGMHILLPSLLALMMALPTAASGEDSFPFRKGSARLSIFFGKATAFDQDYSVFGIGGGYFVADGVEAGLDAESWSGNSPRVRQVSPQLRVVANLAGSIKPYAGAFYRRTSIEAFRDLDTVGARAGGYIVSGRSAFLGVGLAGESHLNCDRTVYASCSEIFPEILIAVIF